MTREEAIEKLQKQKAEYLEEWVDYSGVVEAYDMAIEALQTDRPHGIGYVGVMDDYPVSVKEVLNITAETGALETQRRIKKLQPISRPKGEWIAEEEYGDLWVCDQCGCVSGYKDNFCHNCGADMRVQKVSEEESEHLDKIFPHEEKGEWYDVTKLIEYADMKREKF